MNKLTMTALVPISAALFGACASGGGMYSQPYALFEAAPRMATGDTQPAFIMSIDGRTVSINSNDPVPPGMRVVDVSIPGPPGMSNPGRDTLSVDAKACTRYLLAAQRSSMTGRDWKAFVAASEPIGECAKRFPATK